MKPGTSTIRPILFGLCVALIAVCVVDAPASDYRVFNVGLERFVPLKDVAAVYGLCVTTDHDRAVRMQGPSGRLDFDTSSRVASVNGTSLWLHGPVRKVNGLWSITETDLRVFFDPIFRSYAYLGEAQTKVVVLDPGHGGNDPGATSPDGLAEKTLTLKIARRVRHLLEDQGLRVYMTRDRDCSVPLVDRAVYADRRKADLFVSIHCNAAPNRGAQGLESYVLTAGDYPSVMSASQKPFGPVAYPGQAFAGANTSLAFCLQQAMVRQTHAADRGLRHARFLVLREARCPAALVECGFLSNRGEAAQLRQPEHLDLLAAGISRGILDYLDAVKRARVVLQARQGRDVPKEVAAQPLF